MRIAFLGEKRENSKGFTLVELVIAMTLSLAVSGLVLGFFIDFWRSISALENDSETFVTRQNAGDKLRDALNPASSLINQNSLADSNVSNPDPSDVSGTHWVLNHAIPTTINTPSSGTTPLFYFNAPSVDTSRNLIMNGAQPYLDEYVLYLKSGTKQLLLRTLKNTAATGNRARTTCPAAVASATCPVDTTIANEVSSVSVRYFSRSGNTIDYTSITDPSTGAYIGPDFSAVEVVELTVRLQRKATVQGGFDTKNETTIRVALRNG